MALCVHDILEPLFSKLAPGRGGGGEERERRRETELMPSLSLVEGVSFATAIHTEIRFNSLATLLIDQIKVHPCL